MTHSVYSPHIHTPHPAVVHSLILVTTKMRSIAFRGEWKKSCNRRRRHLAWRQSIVYSSVINHILYCNPRSTTLSMERETWQWVISLTAYYHATSTAVTWPISWKLIDLFSERLLFFRWVSNGRSQTRHKQCLSNHIFWRLVRRRRAAFFDIVHHVDHRSDRLAQGRGAHPEAQPDTARQGRAHVHREWNGSRR